jgi:hypothetical protein
MVSPDHLGFQRETRPNRRVATLASREERKSWRCRRNEPLIALLRMEQLAATRRSLPPNRVLHMGGINKAQDAYQAHTNANDGEYVASDK